MNQQTHSEPRAPVSPDGDWNDLLVSPRAAPNIYRDAESVEIMRQHTQFGRHLGALAVAHAAQRDGAALEWISKSEAWAVLGDRRIPITGYLGSESAVGASIAVNKQMAEELLHAAGVAVPLGRLASSAADAVRAQAEIGGPVVIKPRNGSMGKGVTVNVEAAEHVRSGYRHARKVSRGVLVQPYIHGPEYRAHATGEECVGIFRRLLPSVTGDGHATIGELIAQKNQQRGQNPTTRLHPIPADDLTEGFLARHGLSLDSVLPADVAIVVRDVNGITSGGESEGCFDTVDEKVKAAAVAAVAAIPGMHWAGVDLIVDEASGVPYVIEVNADASIDGSTFPTYGDARDVGEALWRRLYCHSVPDQRGRPLVPQIATADQTVAEVAPVGEGDVALRGLFQAELRRRGLRVSVHGPRVWSAENGAEPARWFRDCLSTSDLLTSTHPLRRRRQLRRILQTMNLRQPSGREVGSAVELGTLQSELGADVALVPMRGVPAGARPRVAGLDEVVEPETFRRRSWFAQRYWPGARHRVLASTAGALLVLAPDGQAHPDAHTLRAVSRLAVQTVRAVPQLRWASIDIVVRRSAFGRGGWLVEDVTQHPSFHHDDQIVAGSFGAVFEVLLARECPGEYAAGRRWGGVRSRHRLRRVRATATRVVKRFR